MKGGKASGGKGEEARLRGALLDLLQCLVERPGEDALLRKIFEILSRLVRVDAMFIALRDDQGRFVKLLETDLDDRGRRVFCARSPLDAARSPVVEALDREPYVLVNRSREELARLGKGFSEGESWTPVGNPKRRSASLLYLPIWFGASRTGILSVQSYRLNAYRAADAERLRVVADYVGLAIRHARLMEGR